MKRLDFQISRLLVPQTFKEQLHVHIYMYMYIYACIILGQLRVQVGALGRQNVLSGTGHGGQDAAPKDSWQQSLQQRGS